MGNKSHNLNVSFIFLKILYSAFLHSKLNILPLFGYLISNSLYWKGVQSK